MKFIFQSKYVNVAVVLGQQPDDEDDEFVSAAGGDFTPAGCGCTQDVEDAFGFSPVRA